jgi:hypothetical protein
MEKGKEEQNSNLNPEGKRRWTRITPEKRQAQEDKLFENIQKSETLPEEKKKEAKLEDQPVYTDKELTDLEKQIPVEESPIAEEPDLSTEPKIPSEAEEKKVKQKQEENKKSGKDEELPWHSKLPD